MLNFSDIYGWSHLHNSRCIDCSKLLNSLLNGKWYIENSLRSARTRTIRRNPNGWCQLQAMRMVCFRAMLLLTVPVGWQLSDGHAIQRRVFVHHRGDKLFDIIADHIALFDGHNECIVFVNREHTYQISLYSIYRVRLRTIFIPRQGNGLLAIHLLLIARWVRTLSLQTMVDLLHEPVAGRPRTVHETVTQLAVPCAQRWHPDRTAFRLADVMRASGTLDKAVNSRLSSYMWLVGMFDRIPGWNSGIQLGTAYVTC